VSRSAAPLHTQQMADAIQHIGLDGVGHLLRVERRRAA
jgi:hypothetical protein